MGIEQLWRSQMLSRLQLHVRALTNPSRLGAEVLATSPIVLRTESSQSLMSSMPLKVRRWDGETDRLTTAFPDWQVVGKEHERKKEYRKREEGEKKRDGSGDGDERKR